jgi:hypothetical protein
MEANNIDNEENQKQVNETKQERITATYDDIR